jgi:hypothetical protein
LFWLVSRPKAGREGAIEHWTPPSDIIQAKGLGKRSGRSGPEKDGEALLKFMYRRPILCTLYGAVDFLKVLKIAVLGGGGVTRWLGRSTGTYNVYFFDP